MPRHFAAHAHARAEVAIRAFETCGRVHAIAVRRVVQTIGRAHVADDGGARVHADPSDAERDARRRGAFLESARSSGPMRAHTPLRVARDRVDRQRCAEEHRDSVADDAIDGSAVLERDAQHAVEVALEQAERTLGRQALGKRREAFEIGEHEAHLAFLAAKASLLRIRENLLDDRRRHVAAERVADEPFLDLIAAPRVRRAERECEQRSERRRQAAATTPHRRRNRRTERPVAAERLRAR